MDAGDRNAAALVAAARPPIFFSRRKTVERAVERWSGPALQRALARLQAAVLASRRRPDLSVAIARQALLGIAVESARVRPLGADRIATVSRLNVTLTAAGGGRDRRAARAYGRRSAPRRPFPCGRWRHCSPVTSDSIFSSASVSASLAAGVDGPLGAACRRQAAAPGPRPGAPTGRPRRCAWPAPPGRLP